MRCMKRFVRKIIYGRDINMNNWKKIWESRVDRLDSIDAGDKEAIFAELKRIDGFDLEGGIPLDSLLKQYEQMKNELNVCKGNTVFEVGCGAGANLYLLSKEGIQVGGLDYSDTLLAILHKVIMNECLVECICDEAKKLPVSICYDAVFSNSVFAYFEDEFYARVVLEKMAQKAKMRIGILDIYDAEKKEECLAYRKQTIENYEEKYMNLPKMFYHKNFFRKFAEQMGMRVWFRSNDMKGYGNAAFTYHCYMEHLPK